MMEGDRVGVVAGSLLGCPFDLDEHVLAFGLGYLEKVADVDQQAAFWSFDERRRRLGAMSEVSDLRNEDRARSCAMRLRVSSAPA